MILYLNKYCHGLLILQFSNVLRVVEAFEAIQDILFGWSLKAPQIFPDIYNWLNILIECLTEVVTNEVISPIVIPEVSVDIKIASIYGSFFNNVS